MIYLYLLRFIHHLITGGGAPACRNCHLNPWCFIAWSSSNPNLQHWQHPQMWDLQKSFNLAAFSEWILHFFSSNNTLGPTAYSLLLWVDVGEIHWYPSEKNTGHLSVCKPKSIQFKNRLLIDKKSLIYIQTYVAKSHGYTHRTIIPAATRFLSMDSANPCSLYHHSSTKMMSIYSNYPQVAG